MRWYSSVFLCILMAAPFGAAAPARKKHAAGTGQRSRIVEQKALSADAVNSAEWNPSVPAEHQKAALIRAQILLDRANFSPGEIDGLDGRNTKVAVKGFQSSHNLPTTSEMDEATWKALLADGGPAMTSYTISDEDVKGPFQPVPKTMEEQATLPALGYQSPQELLGEKFHIKPELLAALNPGKTLSTAGEQLSVPVVPTEIPSRVAKIVVSKSDTTVGAYDASGKLLAQFPATIGSEHDPLPIGTWKVTGVKMDPEFRYNPELFWDAKPGDTKALIKPGPNNPVGVVWIGLTKEHYGIHGTPEPGAIGHAESHGCIRLTNWDAAMLGRQTKAGMQVICQE